MGVDTALLFAVAYGVFDNFGSWMVSFGLGAALVTLSFLALLSAGRRAWIYSGGAPEPRRGGTADEGG